MKSNKDIEQEADKFISTVKSKDSVESWVYCNTAILCAKIIASAILEGAERVRAPYSNRTGPG